MIFSRCRTQITEVCFSFAWVIAWIAVLCSYNVERTQLLHIPYALQTVFFFSLSFSLNDGAFSGSFQGTAAVFYCAALYGWMMYIVMIVTSLQFLTEPCMQSIMARLVDADRQGSLQVRV